MQIAHVHASWSNYKKLKLINFLFDDDSKPTRYETSDDMKPEILKNWLLNSLTDMI